MRVISGSYMRTGSPIPSLEPGANWKLIFQDRASGHMLARLATMTGDGAKRMSLASAFASLPSIYTGNIPAGVTLGSAVDTNTLNAVNHWMALIDNGGDDIRTGTYTNDGVAKTITYGTPFPAGTVDITTIVMGEGAQQPFIKFPTHASNKSQTLTGSVITTGITANQNLTGFSVGTNNAVNPAASPGTITFHYISFASGAFIKPKSWTDNPTSVSGIGLNPTGALIKAEVGTTGIWRNSSHSGSASGAVNNTADVDDAVTAFGVGNALLGGNPAVSAAGVIFHGLFFLDGPSVPNGGGPGPATGRYRLAGTYRTVSQSRQRLLTAPGRLVGSNGIRIAAATAVTDTRAPDFVDGAPTTGTPTATGWSVTFTPDESGTYQVFRWQDGQSPPATPSASGNMLVNVAVSVGVSVPSNTSSVDWRYRIVLKDLSNNARPSSDILVTVPGSGGGSGPDVTAPIISVGPTVSNVTTEAARVNWTTAPGGVGDSGLSTTGLKYWVNDSTQTDGGEGAAPLYTTVNPALVTSHVADLIGLSSAPVTAGNLLGGTPYQVRAISTDVTGLNTVQSSPVSFRTVATVAAPETTLTQMTLAPIEVDATFNSIGILMPFTGDPDGNARVTARFRTADVGSGAGAWRNALEFRRNYDLASNDAANSDKRFAGSIIMCTHNTTYNVELTVIDGVETFTTVITVTTRNDNLGSAYDWTPTHYVNWSWNANGWTPGLDSNNGTSKATPWKTISKAIAAFHADPSITNMRLEVAPGPIPTPLPTGLTERPGKTFEMRAAYPAIDTDSHDRHNGGVGAVRSGTGSGTGRSIINDGLRTRLELRSTFDAGPMLSAPTGTTDPDLQPGYSWSEVTTSGSNANGWSQTTNARSISAPRIGPWKRADGIEAPLPPADSEGVVLTNLWVWEDSPLQANQTLGTARWAPTRDGVPFLIGAWKHAAGNIPSLPEYLKYLRTDPRYRYGMYKPKGDASASATMTPGTSAGAPGSLASINVTDPGYYEIEPTIVLSGGGGGSGATAVPVYDAAKRILTGITVTNGGSGYTSRVAVSIVRNTTSSNPVSVSPKTGDNSGRNIYWLPATDRLGGAVLPNEVWVSITAQSTSAVSGLIVDSPDTRVAGFEWRSAGQFSLIIDNKAKRLLVDQNLFHIAQVGIFYASSTPMATPQETVAAMATDVTIQHNRFVDSGLYDLELTPTHPGVSAYITWLFIKNQETVKAGQNMESRGWNATEAGRRMVLRHNTSDGVWDFGGGKSGNSRDFGRDWDIHDNYHQCGGDDFVDLPWNQINVRVWGNRAMFVTVFLSNTPHSTNQQAGYAWKNVCLQDPTGQAPIPFSYTIPAGSPNAGTFRPAGWINRGALIKMGGGAARSPHWYFMYNTLIVNRVQRRGGLPYAKEYNPSGYSEEGGSSTQTMPLYDNYGNIIHAGRLVVKVMADYTNGTAARTYPGAWAPWNSRKNNYSTSLYDVEPGAPSGTPVIEFDTAPLAFTVDEYKTQVANYPNPLSQGTGSDDNPLGEFTVNVRDYLVDPYETGTLDFRLKAGTNPLVGAGPLVPGLNDLSGDRDLGYAERE